VTLFVSSQNEKLVLPRSPMTTRAILNHCLVVQIKPRA
jgi:hypothetical protein